MTHKRMDLKTTPCSHHLMDLFLTCDRGCAPYVKQEALLKGIKGSCEEYDSCLVMKGLSEEDLVRAAYTLQTPMRIAWLLGATRVDVSMEETLTALEALIQSLTLTKAIPHGMSFTVICDRQGTHDYTSVDIAQETGRLIKRQCKEQEGYTPLVDIKQPDVTIYLFIDEDDAWIGVDLLGKDSSKRAYKVFNNPHSVKGTTAACLLMAAQWTPGQSLLDPFTSGGTIAIEAALMTTKHSPHYYDKSLACLKHPSFPRARQVIEEADAQRAQAKEMIYAFDAHLPNVTAAKKNAKIAGVEKAISFSKLDVEWLDTKLSGKSIQRIVCQPLEASKHVPLSRAENIHKELFYQAGYVLTDDGTLTFLVQKPEELRRAAEQYGFSVKEQHMITTGKLPRWIITFERTKES